MKHKKNQKISEKKWHDGGTVRYEFIDKARSGILKNSEMDAISIRQILADYKRLKELLNSILGRIVKLAIN